MPPSEKPVCSIWIHVEVCCVAGNMETSHRPWGIFHLKGLSASFHYILALSWRLCEAPCSRETRLDHRRLQIQWWYSLTRLGVSWNLRGPGAARSFLNWSVDGLGGRGVWTHVREEAKVYWYERDPVIQREMSQGCMEIWEKAAARPVARIHMTFQRQAVARSSQVWVFMSQNVTENVHFLY